MSNGRSGTVFRVLCKKISTGQEKLAPIDWHDWHVFATLNFESNRQKDNLVSDRTLKCYRWDQKQDLRQNEWQLPKSQRIQDTIFWGQTHDPQFAPGRLLNSQFAISYLLAIFSFRSEWKQRWLCVYTFSHCMAGLHESKRCHHKLSFPFSSIMHHYRWQLFVAF